MLQRLQTPTENISLRIDCSAAHCDFSFLCAIEIFFLTYLLTYLPYILMIRKQQDGHALRTFKKLIKNSVSDSTCVTLMLIYWYIMIRYCILPSDVPVNVTSDCMSVRACLRTCECSYPVLYSTLLEVITLLMSQVC